MVRLDLGGGPEYLGTVTELERERDAYLMTIWKQLNLLRKIAPFIPCICLVTPTSRDRKSYDVIVHMTEISVTSRLL